MIPCAWLGLIIYGQKPRWLSSVTGRLRWRWMFTLMALIAIPYLAMQAFDVLGGALHRAQLASVQPVHDHRRPAHDAAAVRR